MGPGPTIITISHPTIHLLAPWQAVAGELAETNVLNWLKLCRGLALCSAYLGQRGCTQDTLSRFHVLQGVPRNTSWLRWCEV